MWLLLRFSIVKRSETKTTAMRVRLKALSKASLHDIILGVQANINHERRDALWQIVYHTQHGNANII